MSVILLNRYKLHLLAKVVLLSSANFAIFLYADLLGGQAGIQLLFVAMLSLPMILFDKSQNKSRTLFLTIPGFLYFLLELSSYHLIASHQLSAVQNKVVFLAVFICTITINYLAIRFFYMSYQKSEETLLETNSQLEKSNNRLTLNYMRVRQMINKIRELKEALEADLEKGKKLQNSVLPQEPPKLENVIITHAFEAAKALSGDYFYYFPDMSTATIIPKPKKNEDDYDDDEEDTVIVKQVGIVVADVVGKGVAASLEMFSVKTVFMLLHDHWFQPKELVTRLNSMATDSHLFSKYVPLIYVTLTQLDKYKYQLIYVNAGHEYGVLIKANGDIIILDQGGAPAGMDKDERYVETKLILEKDDTLCLFTDGCTDVKSPSGETIGFDELLPILKEAARQDKHDVAKYIRNRLRDFQGNAAQADDMTIVAIKVA